MNAVATIEHALAMHRNGDLAGARDAYAHILEDHPDDVAALHLMGVICSQRHEWREAERWLLRCIAIAPSYAAAHGNLGLVLAERGRMEEALSSIQQSVMLDPAQPGVWSNYGMLLVRCGRHAEAVEACRTALRYAPESAEAECNLANAFRGTGDLRAALDAAQRATDRRPGFAEALNSKGNILAGLGREDEAMEAYARALEVKPGYVSALNNLARLYRERGNLAMARRLYETSIALAPDAADAHWGLAFVHLLAGEMAEGWKEYAWRWDLETAPDARVFAAPRWDGVCRHGMTLLLVCEQGLGDALQFVRYASVLAAQGVRVILEVPESLTRVMHTVPGVDRVAIRGSTLPAHDAYCMLLDLPQLWGTVVETVPVAVPYLRAPEDQGYWDAVLRRDPQGLRIGIAWTGSPGHIDDHRRSCDPQWMVPLAGMDGIVLYNVQKGLEPSAVPGALRTRWRDHSMAFTDVGATAGLVARLDLVITVDTMAAHLAGALGVPVWLMLPHAPDWRWMLDRADTPWYPAMRLFRQRSPRNWEQVMDDVLAALRLYIAQRTQEANGGRYSSSVEEGLLRHEAGDLIGAEASYRAVLRTLPDDADALYLLSVLCHQTQRTGEGIAVVRRLLERTPDHAEGWNSRGNLMHAAGNPDGAEDAFRKALSLRPAYGEAVYNLGRLLCDRWRLEEAYNCFERARILGVPEPQARNNAGLALLRQGRVTDAIAQFDRAIAVDAGCVDAHWNLAHALLQIGEEQRGWPEFEWRWARPEFRAMRDRYRMPWWDGTPMPDRTILLWTEQGFGDAIHFLRYLPLVASRGLRIVVECPAPLLRLVAMTGHAATVVARGDTLPPHDVQCALMSLPAVLGLSDHAIDHEPLLCFGQDVRADWHERLAVFGSRLRIGLVWSGSRTNPAGSYRSIPLAQLESLADIPGVACVSLQKDDPEGEFSRSRFAENGADWTGELTDFATTAALIAELDVIVTIDTGVAHVAGALGKETLLLLSKHHDWRWGTGGETSSWYPSFRLIRQTRQGQWDDVVSRCREHLQRRLAFEGSVNAGVLSLYEGRPGHAVRDLDRAVALAPDHVGAHFNHALALLGAGDWQKGFAEYEWRLQMEHGHTSFRPYPQPRWAGGPLDGETIFVYAEQGFGDAIQFVRYASLLRERGARVVVECRRELGELLRFADGVDEVVVRGDEPHHFDTHVPMLSLPGIFGTTPGTVPARVPYIQLPPSVRPLHHAVLADAGEDMTVGIVWSGNSVSSVDRERSVTREELLRFLPAEGVTYVTLQPRSSAEEPGVPQSQCRHRILDASGAINDFLDTARIIDRLDVVISVDTAVAHLAGALGIPVLTLIPVHSDWRWLTGTDTTPWYPSMRLRRQTRRGAWGDVLHHVAEDLMHQREHHDRQ
jgi:tetratricopeptide (TPR) repeat protein